MSRTSEIIAHMKHQILQLELMHMFSSSGFTLTQAKVRSHILHPLLGLGTVLATCVAPSSPGTF